MIGKTYTDFANDLIIGLGFRPNIHSRNALGAMFVAEGKNKYWNPLNWTLPDSYPKYNRAGVRKYPDYETGVKETVYEYKVNSRWKPFVKSLNKTTDRNEVLYVVQKIYSSWGSYPNFHFTTAAIEERLSEVIPS